MGLVVMLSAVAFAGTACDGPHHLWTSAYGGNVYSCEFFRPAVLDVLPPSPSKVRISCSVDDQSDDGLIASVDVLLLNAQQTPCNPLESYVADTNGPNNGAALTDKTFGSDDCSGGAPTYIDFAACHSTGMPPANKQCATPQRLAID
jgi:hypothetical protein